MSRPQDPRDVSSSPKSSHAPVPENIGDLIETNSDEATGVATIVQPSPSRNSRVGSGGSSGHSNPKYEEPRKRTEVVNIAKDSHATLTSRFGKFFSALGLRTRPVQDEEKGHCVISAICKPHDPFKYYSSDYNAGNENSTEVYTDPELAHDISSANGPENQQRSTPSVSRLVPTTDLTKVTGTLHSSIFTHGKILYAIGMSGFEGSKDDVETPSEQPAESPPTPSSSEISSRDSDKVHEYKNSQHGPEGPMEIPRSSASGDFKIQDDPNSTGSQIQSPEHKDDSPSPANDGDDDDFTESPVPMFLPMAWTTPEKNAPSKCANSGQNTDDFVEIEMSPDNETGTDDNQLSNIPGSSVLVQDNNSDQSGPTHQAHSNPIIMPMPSVNRNDEYDVNQSEYKRTALWNKSFQFLSAFGIRSYQDKEEESQNIEISTIKKPLNPDEGSSSKEIRDTTVVRVDTSTQDEEQDGIEQNSGEETEGLQRPTSIESGVSSDNTETNVDSGNNSIDSGQPNNATCSRWKSPLHLHTYFKFMYITGVCAYRGNEETPIQHVGKKFQKIEVFIISILSFLYAVENLKFWSLDFLMDKSVKGYVLIGFQVIHCISAVYFFKFAAFDSMKIATMLDIILKDSPNDANTIRNSARKIPRSSLALLLGVASVVFAFVATQFDVHDVKSVLGGDALLHRSYDISYALFMWDVNNSSDKDRQLAFEYGQEFTLTSLLFGVLGSAMEFFGKIQQYALRDLMLLAALTLYQKVENFTTNLPTNGSVTSNQIEDQMMKFKYLQSLSEKIAHTFGVLTIIFHFKNLLLFTFFFLDLMDGTFVYLSLLFSIFDIAKIFVTYMISAKASRINQTFLKWLRKQCNGNDRTRGQNSGIQVAVSNLELDELKSEPVGLGAGLSFMSVSSLAKFLGYVVSCFLFFEKDD